MASELWLECEDADSLLRYFRRSASERKRRLFAVACCRCAVRPSDRKVQRFLITAERFADGLVTETELIAAQADAARLAEAADQAAAATIEPEVGRWDSDYVLAGRANAAQAILNSLSTTLDARMALDVVETVWFALMNDGPLDQAEAWADWLRDLRSPPRRVRLDPSWITANRGRVRRLAERLYAGKDWSALPVLADALEEAGCTSALLLDHLHSPGPHTLGCWALDLVLGKR
jgi:hypothetical protein